MESLGLKNINMLSKEQYDAIAEPTRDELFVVSSSGFGFPSNNYDDLELGADGTTYIAPAAGWFLIRSDTVGWVYLLNNTSKVQQGNYTSVASPHAVLVEARKGDAVSVFYSGTISTFRFIYAEGE